MKGIPTYLIVSVIIIDISAQLGPDLRTPHLEVFEDVTVQCDLHRAQVTSFMVMDAYVKTPVCHHSFLDLLQLHVYADACSVARVNVDSGHQKGVAETDIIISQVLLSPDERQHAPHPCPGHWVGYDLVDYTGGHVHLPFLCPPVPQLALFLPFEPPTVVGKLLPNYQAPNMHRK